MRQHEFTSNFKFGKVVGTSDNAVYLSLVSINLKTVMTYLNKLHNIKHYILHILNLFLM